MEYEDELVDEVAAATDTEEVVEEVVEVKRTKAENRKLQHQRQVDVRRRVEEILMDKMLKERFGDPFEMEI